MEYMLEVCVDNIDSAINAENGGADRVELCSALEVGGVTPSAGLLKLVKQNLTIPVFMLIRPRAGNFEYSELELAQMEADIRVGLRYQVDGFVTGALKNGKVDTDACQRLISEAMGLPVTFHRAFDLITDNQALNDITSLGFSRILTSGCAPTALEGKDRIKTLVERAGRKIIIMPGSGINPENILEISRHTKAFEFHSSAQGESHVLNPQHVLEATRNIPSQVYKFHASAQPQGLLINEERIVPVVQGASFCPMASCGVVKTMKRLLDS